MKISNGLAALRNQRLRSATSYQTSGPFPPLYFLCRHSTTADPTVTYKQLRIEPNLSEFEVQSKMYSALITTHSKKYVIGEGPSPAEFSKSLAQPMSSGNGLVTVGSTILYMLHTQYPSVDVSRVYLQEYPSESPPRSFLEVNVKNATSHGNEPTTVTIQQKSHYHDKFQLVDDESFLYVKIHIVEVASYSHSEATDSRGPIAGAADFVDQDSAQQVLHTGFERLIEIINKEKRPPHYGIRRLAIYIFEDFNRISLQNRLNEVHIRLKDSHKAELFQHCMTKNEFEELAKRKEHPANTEESVTETINHRAYIALGSNIGDRIAMLEAACTMMEDEGLRVQHTSSLYESTPMYIERQDKFINGVCQILTELLPWELLSKLKAIEQRLGRVKIIDKGPRSIDLDILFYDDHSVRQPELTIPHKAMVERAFVIRPLCDISSSLYGNFAAKKLTWIDARRQDTPRFKHYPTFQELLPHLTQKQGPLFPITPLSSFSPPIVSELPTRKTRLMAILNLTPDSFSDGGKHQLDLSTILKTLRTFVKNGATIVDIGGQSSRPGAIEVSAEEEAARILPVINLIQSNAEFNSVAISVDTYRASVAEAAIKAGAHIVNDVSAGLMDSEMLSTVARLGCTIILGHMRGTPLTMTKMTNYNNSTIQTIGEELNVRFRAAEKAGIYRWRIILDPGIGFAKNEQQNLEILRDFGKLRETECLKGLPWCVGSSRKGFVGKITGVEIPKDRVIGSAMCVAAAIQGGAEIVRAHDVKETAEAIKMADAIWRAEEKQVWGQRHEPSNFQEPPNSQVPAETQEVQELQESGEHQDPKEPQESENFREAQAYLDSKREDQDFIGTSDDVDPYDKG